jgi:hypothetical protein
MQQVTEDEELYLSALREEGVATEEGLEVHHATEEEELYLCPQGGGCSSRRRPGSPTERIRNCTGVLSGRRVWPQ